MFDIYVNKNHYNKHRLQRDLLITNKTLDRDTSPYDIVC